MAQNQLLPILYQPTGGMSSDLSPLTPMQRGTYLDSLNLHFLTQLGSTTVALENCLGNSFSFELGTVTTQNKVFRVYLADHDFNVSADNVVIDLYSPNNVLIDTAFVHYTSGYVTASTIYTDLISAMTGSWTSTFVAGAFVPTGSTTGYFTLEITQVPFWNYVLDMSTIGTDGKEPIIIQEAIPVNLAGMLRFIGSYDLSGDGIIWSTPQTNFPSNIGISGTANNGGLIRITTNTDHGLSSNEEVSITGVLGTVEANGIWIITVISATEFDLQGSVYSTVYAGGGIVTINYEGVGEIGVAQFSQNSSTWNYITLLRSREFNFSTKHQPKTVCERKAYSANIYWTDNYNPYRRLYYIGNYQTDGALNFVDSQNEYFYGTIDLQTRLFQGNGLANIEYSDQLQSGGTLFAGNYRYIVRFLDDFFNPTLWTDPSGIFVVSENPLTPNTDAVATQVYGNNSTDQTSKINQMLLTGIVPNLFKYVELGALFYVNGTTVPIGNIVSRTLLTQSSCKQADAKSIRRAFKLENYPRKFFLI